MIVPHVASRLRPVLFTAVCLLSLPALAAVQSGAAPAREPSYPPVHAPNAQKLVTAVTARHPEAQLVGLHLTPPADKQNVIIASNVAAKVGKPSSEGDLAVMQSGKTVARRKDKDGVYDIQMQLTDSHGKVIGMMVELLKIDAVSDQAAAITSAEGLRKELEAGIVSEAWLFGGQ